MRSVIPYLFACVGLNLWLSAAAQPTINPALLTMGWEARWIHPPGVPLTTYGVFHFRKTFSLEAIPAAFVVNVSGDNRYRLFVNGQAVLEGPARSDPGHWYFDTHDLKPYLRTGANVLAAQVWNAGEGKPYAQMSYQTGFILQGEGAAAVANTGTGWKSLHNQAYKPLPPNRERIQTYLVTGDGDEVSAARYPWGWEQPGYDDSGWAAASAYWFAAKPRGVGTDGNWCLAPRPIPQMEQRPERLQAVRRAEGVSVSPDFVLGKAPLTVPARSRVKILLDRGHLTNAYPELVVSGGLDARLTLTYAEALIDENRIKGNRNEIEGKQIIGVQDRFIADGGNDRHFRPLWWRSYRYLELEVETAGEPVTVQDLYGTFTAYPFVEQALFDCDDPRLKAVWEVGWRTARLCAAENYMDCPYYEQLQYVGDTRIQALISLYVSGDDRLMRKAIEDFAHSMIPEGLTQSRYPCADPQVIPTYSLFWVSMIHDYWMHRRDDAFIRQHQEGIRDILAWFEARRRADGLMGKAEWWNFVDWSWPWEEVTRVGGVPPGVFEGGSSILSLQYAYTLRQAADLFAYWGDQAAAQQYRKTAETICAAVYNRCWDPARQLLADTPDLQSYSQHAHILGILTDAVPAKDQPALLRRIMADTSLTQATFYFQFYLFEAMKKTGQGDLFLPALEPWHEMIGMGLTTFAEKPEPTRSDCHAWSAAPVYELLSTVLGVSPAAPGFTKVQITPYPGTLSRMAGTVAHPDGMIAVQLRQTDGRLTGNVILPGTLTGKLTWKGKSVTLVAGQQEINL